MGICYARRRCRRNHYLAHMFRIARFQNPLKAYQAAAFLTDRGVPAQVVGEHINAIFHMEGLPWFRIDVMIASREQAERARELLEEFESLPPIDDSEWENQALPDLSLLDDLDIDICCPHCRTQLPLDAALEICPNCGRQIDLCALIGQVVGHNQLAQRYEDLSPFGIAARPFYCRSCGQEITEPASQGRCSQCGSLFERADAGR